jgi:hypothetical protein
VGIDVTFEINADGIVNVTARDPESGHQASTQITLSSGLSEGEIQEIIEEGRTDRVRTAVLEERFRQAPTPGAQGEEIGRVALTSVAPELPRPAESDAIVPADTDPGEAALEDDELLETAADEGHTDDLEIYDAGADAELLPETDDDGVEILDEEAPEPGDVMDPAETDPHLADTQPADRALFETPGQDLSTLQRSKGEDEKA